MPKIPTNVRKALRAWQDNRDMVVELVAEQGASAVNDDERDGLLCAAESLAVAVERWLCPSPTENTGGGER